MTSEELDTILQQLGAIKYCDRLVAPCRVCQPEETERDRMKLYVTPGNSLPLVLFCMRCCIPKPCTEEDRRHNTSIIQRNLIDSGVNTELFYTKINGSERKLMWSESKYSCQPTEAVPERASDSVLHYCYNHLLSNLSLTDTHKRWLKRRGLDPDHALSIQYRSTPTKQQAQDIAKSLIKEKGLVFCQQVPGLLADTWLTREDALLIPCRDAQGRIGAIKQRLMGEGTNRMRLLSGGSAKAKQLVHYPLGFYEKVPLWITEGERKADIVYAATKLFVIGIPGVGTFAQALEPAIKAGKVVLALDKDDAGITATIRLAKLLDSKGVEVQLAKWDSKYKKIDDAITKGCEVGCVGVGPFLDAVRKREQKTQPAFRRQLKPDEIVDYIKQKGPLLRDELKVYPTIISALIKEGRIKMTKTQQGQVLSV